MVASHKGQEKQEKLGPPNFAALSGLHEKMTSRVEVEMRRRSRVERVDRVEATIRRHPNHIQWISYRRARPFFDVGACQEIAIGPKDDLRIHDEFSPASRLRDRRQVR